MPGGIEVEGDITGGEILTLDLLIIVDDQHQRQEERLPHNHQDDVTIEDAHHHKQEDQRDSVHVPGTTQENTTDQKAQLHLPQVKDPNGSLGVPQESKALLEDLTEEHPKTLILERLVEVLRSTQMYRLPN